MQTKFAQINWMLSPQIILPSSIYLELYCVILGTILINPNKKLLRFVVGLA